MAHDVLTQLRAYAADLDHQAPSLHELMPAPVDTRRPQPARPPRRRWVAAALAAVVALILIGGVALLTGLTGEDEEIIDQPTSTITTPELNSDAGGSWSQLSDPAGDFQQASIVNIVTGHSKMLAVGNVPEGLGVWTSIDGIAWSRVAHDEATFGPGDDYYLNVTGAAAGKTGFVAVGASWKDDAQTPLVWYSADGTDWTRIVLGEASASAMDMRAVVAGGPGFVAVGSSGPYPMVWTSVDGRDWAPIADTSEVFAPQAALTEIVGYEGRLWTFASGGQGIGAWTSADGFSWEQLADGSAFGGPGHGLDAVAVGEAGLVVAGFHWSEESGTRPIAWYSSDGLSWTRTELEPSVPGLTVWDMTASGTGFVAVGNLGDSAFELELPFNFVLRSEDGLSWDKVDNPAFADAQLQTVTAGGPGLVAGGLILPDDVAGKAPIWTSSPGDLPTTDTNVSTPTTTTSTTVITEPLPSGEWTRWPVDPEVFGSGWISDVVAGGPGLVAVGGSDGSGTAWLSEDGITWRAPDGFDGFTSASSAHALTAGGNGLVAVGRENLEGGALAWFSTDGIEWSRSVLPDGRGAHDVVATDGGYVAVGDVERLEGSSYLWRGAVWASPDGLTWTRVPHDPAVFDDGYPTAIVRTENGLVAVGPIWEDIGFAVWTSSEGLTWTKRVADTGFPGPSHMFDLTVGTPGLLAVGNGSFGGMWLSPDGVDWQAVGDFSARSIAPLGGGFVAVGYSSCDATGCTSAAWTSPDGITWTEQPVEPGFFDGEWSTVRAAGPGLVAFSSLHSGPGEFAGSGHWTWGD